MITYFLIFDNETEALEQLALAYPATDENGEPTYQSHSAMPNAHAVSVVGTIYQPTGEMLTDEDGIEYPELQPIDGYHVNIVSTVDLPETLQPFLVAPVPDTPAQTFAGIST